MNDARHNAQNGDFEAPNFQMTNVAAKDDAMNHLMRVREPYTTFCGLPVARGMPKAEPGAEVCEDCERVFRAMRHPDRRRDRDPVEPARHDDPSRTPVQVALPGRRSCASTARTTRSSR